MRIRFSLGLMAPLLLAAVWLLPWPDLGGSAKLLTALLLLIIAATLIPLLEKFSRAVAVVCRDRVLWRQGVPGIAPVHDVPRSAIASASVFEGDDTVVLHGSSGDLAELSDLSESRDMAFALDVPVSLWVSRTAPRHGRRLSRSMVYVGGACTMYVSVSMAISVAAHLGAHGLSDLRAIVARIAIYLGILGFGVLLHLAEHWLQARSMTAEQRRESACWLLDPRYRGRHPHPTGKRRWWARLMTSARKRLYRRIYGGPYPSSKDLKPFEFAPGAREPIRKTG